MNIDDLRTRLRKIVDLLPQRRHIPDAVAERWIDGVLQLDPERALWHVERAFGIGGSEIGEILLASFKEPPYLNDPEAIWRSKMLLELPSRENIHMARGTMLEDLVGRLYQRCTGNQSILNDPNIKKALSSPHPDGKFIIGNPDEVALNGDNKIVIPDFKVRSSLDWRAPLELVNIAQVHWYGSILAKNASQPIAHYALAELDIPNTLANSIMDQLKSDDLSTDDKNQLIEDMAHQIQKINLPGFGIRISSFDRNEQLENDLIRVGRDFWEKNVLAGVPYIRPGKSLISEIPEDVQESIHAAFNDVLRFRLAERVAKEQSSKATQQITALLNKYDLANFPINVPGITHSQNQKLDLQAAGSALVAKGTPVESLQKVSTGKLDLEKAEQVLKANNLLSDAVMTYEWDRTAIKKAYKDRKDITLENFEHLAVRAGLSTRKADKETIMHLTEDMEVHLKRFYDTDSHTPDDSEDVSEEALRLA